MSESIRCPKWSYPVDDGSRAPRVPGVHWRHSSPSLRGRGAAPVRRRLRLAESASETIRSLHREQVEVKARDADRAAAHCRRVAVHQRGVHFEGGSTCVSRQLRFLYSGHRGYVEDDLVVLGIVGEQGIPPVPQSQAVLKRRRVVLVEVREVPVALQGRHPCKPGWSLVSNPQ